jgi:hypothetical protein
MLIAASETFLRVRRDLAYRLAVAGADVIERLLF